MASQSLISAVNSYDNYIQRKGIDEQVIDAYIEACRVAINGEKDITYGLQITNRSKGIVERFCMEKTGGTIWDLDDVPDVFSNFALRITNGNRVAKVEAIQNPFSFGRRY